MQAYWCRYNGARMCSGFWLYISLLGYNRLGYSRLSTWRGGEILPQNVSRDEERWAAVFRQVCTVNNKAKQRNDYDLFDSFLQITPEHPATHLPLQKENDEKYPNGTLGLRHPSHLRSESSETQRRFHQRDIVNWSEISTCKFLKKLAKVRRISPVLPINLDFPIGLLWTLLPRRWLSLWLLIWIMFTNII